MAGRGADRETAAPWAAIVLEVPESIEDDLAAEIGDGSLGVLVDPGPPGRSLLRICVPAGVAVEAVSARAAEALRGRGLDPTHRLRVEPIEDGRWVERYQAGLAPLPIGERFVVVPGAERPRPGSRRPILVVPGRAFGTGEHPTTRLSAAALERLVAPGSRWLDLGTGSGILAVVAALCGAVEVDAVDVDPDAVETALETVRANGLPDRIRVSLGSADAFAGALLDGCVANVATPYFLARSREAAAMLGPGGYLLATGILASDSGAAESALRAAGLEVVDSSREGDWILLVARAPGATAR